MIKKTMGIKKANALNGENPGSKIKSGKEKATIK
jgi:hypothetical protein